MPPSARSTISPERLCALGLALALSCAGPPPRQESPLPVRTATPPAEPAAATAGPWERAAAGDDLAVRRLAELHPAPELWRVVEGDRRRAKAAIAALAHAPDAELVMGDAAEMALAGERRRDLLELLWGLAARRPQPVERLDPPSLRRAVEALDALSRDARAEDGDRALAVSALRALARAGYLDEKRITTSLDPSPAELER